MTEKVQAHPELRDTVFGEVVCEILEAREIPATAFQVNKLAEECGLDGRGVLDRMSGTRMEHVGYFDEFSRRLDLSEAEIMHLAFAYALEERWGADGS